MKKEELKQILLRLGAERVFEALYPFLKIVVEIQKSSRGVLAHEAREILRFKKLIGLELTYWESEHLRSYSPRTLEDLKLELERTEAKTYRLREDEQRIMELRGLIANAEAHGGIVSGTVKRKRSR